MKIVASIGNDKVLVEMTKTEIGRVHGVEGYYADISKSWLEIGYEFDIAKAFEVTKNLKNLDRSKIEHILIGLKTATDQVIELQNQIQSLTLFDTLKHDA